jgi:hypothetical protein
MMRKLSIPLAIGVVLLLAAPSFAQIGKREVKDAIYKLKSPNPEEVLSSVQLLAASGSNSAVGPLTDLLRGGPRNDITNAVIQALGSIRSKASVAILIEYLEHRRPDARTAAIYALEGYKEAKVQDAIENRLRDSDTQVRNAAAVSLGQRGNKASVPILFQAFDRGVHDAAIAIGQIGTPADAQRMAGYLGKDDTVVLLKGFWEFLTRTKFPKKAKIEILEQLFELAGPDVHAFAVRYKATFPPGTEEDENDLFKLVSRMVRQIAEK